MVGQFQNLGLRSSCLRDLELEQVASQDMKLSDGLDCSALERFSINNLSFLLFRHAGARLQGLRSLRVDRCWSYDWLLESFKPFLCGCSALEDLDLTGFTAQLDEGLIKHLGKTLTTLRL